MEHTSAFTSRVVDGWLVLDELVSFSRLFHPGGYGSSRERMRAVVRRESRWKGEIDRTVAPINIRSFQVVFKQDWDHPMYLCGYSNGSLGATSQANAHEAFWVPENNGNGTWSFRSVHGTYLSPLEDGGVTLMPHNRAREYITMEYW